MGKSKKVVAQSVPYGKASYQTPFGSWGNDGGQNFTSSLSQPQQQQLDLSQSAYYDIMKNLPTDGPFGSASMNNFSNPNSYLGAYNKAYTDIMDRQVGTPLAQKNAGQYGGDSTIGRYAMNDYLTKSRDQGILSSANLANTNYNAMLSGLTGVGSGINDIYTRMMGQANQGLGQQNSWLSNEQRNADRAFQASQINTAAANKRQQDMYNALSDVALIAAAPFTGGASLMMMDPFGGGGSGGYPSGMQGGNNSGYKNGDYGILSDGYSYLKNMLGLGGSSQYGNNSGQSEGSSGSLGFLGDILNGGLNAFTGGLVSQGNNPTGQIDSGYGIFGGSSGSGDQEIYDYLASMFPYDTEGE